MAKTLAQQRVATCSSYGGLAQSALAQAQASLAAAAAQQNSWNTGAGNFTGQPVGGWSGACSGASTQHPEYRDPMEYATETALKQPADKRWRRFQHAMFLREDVIGIYAEGSGSVAIRLCRLGSCDYNHVFTLPFDCDDPVQWFADHVLNMEFPNAKRAT